MIVAYIIASHINPTQVLRLIARIRLERPHAPIVLHHDPIIEPIDLSRLSNDHWIRVIKHPFHGEWGSFSLVALTIAAIEELLAWGIDFDYATFLSGQDYPVSSLPLFEAKLTGDGAIVMTDNRARCLDRYRFTYFRLPQFLETRTVQRLFFVLDLLSGFQPLLRFTTGRIGCRVGFRTSRRGSICGFTVHKGFQWWTLSKRALLYVLAFMVEHNRFVKHFSKRALLPDEAFFQTILASGNFILTDDDDRYVKWPSSDAMNPSILESSDFQNVLSSGKSFARKFDMSVDSEILDRLDERALGSVTRGY